LLMRIDSRFSTITFIVTFISAILNAFFVAIFLLSHLIPPILLIFEWIASFANMVWYIYTAIYTLYKKI
jgi:hypothetical protein